MPCSRYLCKLHCSVGTRWQKWWTLCQYRTPPRWMSSGPHSMRWQRRLCCKAGSSCMWVCAWIACPSGDASASPVLGSGSSSPDSDFQGLLIPAPSSRSAPFSSGGTWWRLSCSSPSAAFSALRLRPSAHLSSTFCCSAANQGYLDGGRCFGVSSVS